LILSGHTGLEMAQFDSSKTSEGVETIRATSLTSSITWRAM
jgi:hypothetical protein